MQILYRKIGSGLSDPARPLTPCIILIEEGRSWARFLGLSVRGVWGWILEFYHAYCLKHRFGVLSVVSFLCLMNSEMQNLNVKLILNLSESDSFRFNLTFERPQEQGWRTSVPLRTVQVQAGRETREMGKRMLAAFSHPQVIH